jgi:hypothetical protein
MFGSSRYTITTILTKHPWGFLQKLLLGGCDVLIHAEQVCRIIALLDLG